MTSHAVSECYGITPIHRMDSHPLDPLDLADAQEAWRGWVCSHDSPAIKAGQRHSRGRQIRACQHCPLSGKPDIEPTSPNDRVCEGFRMPAAEGGVARAWAAGVGKPPREETAGRETRAVRRALWGFECRECCA